MKKRVKTRQLSLLFSLMIIGVLVLIVLISISNYNKIIKKDLKGELGTAGIFPMAGGPCIDNNDTIMRLSSSENSHGALWNDTVYTYAICYSSIFNQVYSGTNPHDCILNNINKVVGLSDIRNAHLEIPSLSNYGTNVCYGNLSCRGVSSGQSGEGLIAYYPFEGNANDLSGNNHNGAVNGALFVSGKLGQGANFDGINDYISVPRIMPLLNGTISLWVKRNGAGSAGTNYIYYNDVFDGGFNRFYLQDNNGNLQTTIGKQASSNTINLLGSDWNHVAVIYNTTNYSVYFNGVLNGTFNKNYWNALDIGYFGSSSGSSSFSGLIDEVKIWNRVLSQSEIQSEYNKTGCELNEKAVIALYSNTDAHASNESGAYYSINICCKSSIECANDNQCPGGQNCSSTGQCIDITPPNISSVSSSPASLSTIINWNTEENTNSSINYGTSSSNLNTSWTDGSRILSHSATIEGLTASTVYYYNITCCDSSGNCATSGIYSFTTSNESESTSTPGTPSSPSSPSTPSTPRTNNIRISLEDKSVEVGKLIEFSVSAVGLNQSKLNYSVKNLPSGASFDSRIGRFSWTPGIVGEYIINFSVTDKKLTNINIIKITVTEEPSSVTIPEPTTPAPAPKDYGTIIFWIIIIVLIIAIIIVGILIFIFIKKKQAKNPPVEKNLPVARNPSIVVRKPSNPEGMFPNKNNNNIS